MNLENIDISEFTPDVFEEKCPSRMVLRHVTGRWGLLVLHSLCDGKAHRFSELRRKIVGISEKMLAQTLGQLERDGFVTRTVYPVVPPHVDYCLTSFGRDFSEKSSELVFWLEENMDHVLSAREAYDAK